MDWGWRDLDPLARCLSHKRLPWGHQLPVASNGVMVWEEQARSTLRDGAAYSSHGCGAFTQHNQLANIAHPWASLPPDSMGDRTWI